MSNFDKNVNVNMQVNLHVNLNVNCNICKTLVTNATYTHTHTTSRQNAICLTPAFGRQGHKKKGLITKHSREQ